MVTPGNHDVSCHVTGDHGCPEEERNFSQFNARYKMPSYPHDHNLWYSFDIGPVHFVSIDTESDFKDAPTTPHTWVGGGKGGGFGDQLAWFREDLAQARNSSDFIVVFGHRPWYSPDGKWNDWPIRAPVHLQAAFEPLFHEFAVDMYICGHKYYYERAERTRTNPIRAERSRSLAVQLETTRTFRKVRETLISSSHLTTRPKALVSWSTMLKPTR